MLFLDTNTERFVCSCFQNGKGKKRNNMLFALLLFHFVPSGCSHLWKINPAPITELASFRSSSWWRFQHACVWSLPTVELASFCYLISLFFRVVFRGCFLSFVRENSKGLAEKQTHETVRKLALYITHPYSHLSVSLDFHVWTKSSRI